MKLEYDKPGEIIISILFIGEAGVGKTQLINLFQDLELEKEYIETYAPAYLEKLIEIKNNIPILQFISSFILNSFL